MKKIILILLFFCFVSTTFAEYDSSQDNAIKIIYDSKDSELFNRKCTICHSTERIFKKGKLKPWEWEDIVLWMQKQIDGAISEEEAKKIINYLSSDQYLFEYKCSGCHTIDSVINKTYKNNDWIKIINAMQKKQPGLISDEEINRIVSFLSGMWRNERKKMMQKMFLNLVFLEENFDSIDLTKLFHSAETLSVCADGLCRLPPLESSNEFDKFARKLDQLAKELKDNVKSKNITLTRENLGKIRKICGECHGVVRK